MAESAGILDRYALVLDVLAAAPAGLSLTEIIAGTELPRGTTHRLVNALVRVGYVVRREERKIYILGPRLLRLLHLGAAPGSVAALARPLLEALVVRFHETAFLAKLVGRKVETILAVAPDNEQQSFVYPGRAMPMHATASGKAILAYQTPRRIAAYVAAPHERFTDATRVGAEAIGADLAEVRARGYGICDGELVPGVLSYACPVRLDGAGVLYSLGLVGIAPRLRSHPVAGVVAALGAAADELAAGLARRAEEPAFEPAPANATARGTP